MKKSEIVSRDPEVVSGALVFAGTRVPVEVLVQHSAAGTLSTGFWISSRA